MCVCSRLISMRVESLCKRGRASYEYVRGEFACMCVSDFMCVIVHFICICLSTDFDELTP